VPVGPATGAQPSSAGAPLRGWESGCGFDTVPGAVGAAPPIERQPSTMLFRALDIPGLWLIELERLEDERGFFSRLFCSEAFLKRGLCAAYPQWSVSFNAARGTLRGLHFQAPPHEEVKLVSCTRGAVFDVAVDVRAGSLSRGRWVGVELSADNGSTLYIPAGFAHGFQTLTDDAQVLYHISERHHPEAAHGVRWDDPDLAIAWPQTERRVISGRDRALPRLCEL
jgi:dTDP-4-dehydrorhamnose 3,5-epimerase